MMNPVGRRRGLWGSMLALMLVASATALAGSTDNAYHQHNLVTSGAVPADHTDPNLINAWGIAFSPFGPNWVADNNGGVSTVYDGAGNTRHPPVAIPGPMGGPGTPTGVVFNGSSDFVVTKGGTSGASLFLFAAEDGTILGWNPTVDAASAIIARDDSKKGAVYKGLAMAANGNHLFLYATDFHNGKVRVFNSNFEEVLTFTDPGVPTDFAPFGIRNINGDLYVTYARQKLPARHDDQAGPGNGFVDIFNPEGHLIRRVVSRGKLNSPWGLALAPADFGKFSNRLLVGNFGDGTLNAYDLATGAWVGPLRKPDGQSLQIDGLWGLSFGNGAFQQPINVLFFAAGPVKESAGLYGRLEAVPGIWHSDTAEPEGE